ncbi:hypothetical protein ASF92_20330 [Pedobacter sp. Leaf176]|nr:hypothetical protein ASF92_20330 [Pedobacter sp. Leaf176]
MEYEKGLIMEAIIGCSYNIHNHLGPGFPERIYSNALKIKVKQINLRHEVEKEFKVIFEGSLIGTFRCDLVVEDSVIVDL